MKGIDLRVGIVIPTKNRDVNVCALLRALEQSTVHPFICVVVDASDYEYSLPECSFGLLFLNSEFQGQVRQRNYGVDVISGYENIEYVIFLDDDIVPAPDAIASALCGAKKFVEEDSSFVGFSFNIINKQKAANFSRKILLYPQRPGVVTVSAFGSSLCGLCEDVEAGWVIGGAALWRRDFLVSNPNDYPFSGKAYGEDLYYSSKVRNNARFAAIANAKCLHIDHYEHSVVHKSFAKMYREGFQDAKVHIYIASAFTQYSRLLTALHVLWIGIIGFVSGLVTLKYRSVALGLGRMCFVLFRAPLKKRVVAKL